MLKIWSFWKRGWWAWLMVLCLNVSGAAIMLIPSLLFRDNKAALIFGCLLAWFVIGAPAWGWIFEMFATKSMRLTDKDL